MVRTNQVSIAIPLLLCLNFLMAIGSPALSQSKADSLFAKLAGMDEVQQADFINQHFYTFYSNDFDVAINLGEQALAISQKNELPTTEALTLKNLGVVHYLKGNYEKALDYYQKALDLYESLNDLSGQGTVLREMANYFKKIGQHDKALTLLGRALELCTTAKDTNCIAASLDIRGVVFLEMGELDEAENNFSKEIGLLESNGNEMGLSYTLNNLASVATERGFFENAIQLLDRSTEIRQRLGDEQGVAINFNNEGEIWLRADQPNKALPYFYQALEMSEAIGFNDLRRHAMQMLSDAYLANGDPDQSVIWLQKSYALKDSLFNVERSRQLAEMATKYESEKQGKELAQQEMELQRRNVFLTLALLGLVVLASVFGIVWWQQKMKQRQLENEAALKADLAKSELSNRLQSERLRISRDLHDNLGAELTIISSSLSRKAFQTKNEVEKQELETINSNARQAMDQLRETIWAIRHEEFSIKQLADKISDFANRATPIPIEIRTPEIETSLSATQTLNLYRIAQEAITNAAKYAHANKVQLVFSLNENEFLMKITDDGKGMDNRSTGNGYGLSNMNARAEELDGKLEIMSNENGTCLMVTIPVGD